MTKRERIDGFVRDAVEAWYASGRTYTCAAVVYDVIDPVARSLCDGTSIRPRQVANLAYGQIHARQEATRHG